MAKETYFPKKNRVLHEIVNPFLQRLSPWKMRLAPGTLDNYWTWSRSFIGEFYKNWEKYDEITNKKGKNWKKKAPDFVQALKDITHDQFQIVSRGAANTKGTKELWFRLYEWIEENFHSLGEFDPDEPIFHSCSLFSGAGGCDLGIEATGKIETAFASDFCPITKETFLTNFPHVENFALGDIRELLRQHVFIDLAYTFHLVTAGFPCQPYSALGKRRGAEDERDRFPDTVQAILQLKPTAFILENVDQLTGKRWLPLLEEKIAELEAAGYRTDYRVLSASEWGSATSRRRLFIVGSRKGYIKWPVVQNGDPLRPEAPLMRNQTVRDAIPNSFGTQNPNIVEYKCPIYWKHVGKSPYTSGITEGYMTQAKILDENAPCPTITTTPLVHYFDTEGQMTNFWSDLFTLKEKEKEGGKIWLAECGLDYWLEDPVTGRSNGWIDAREGPVPGAVRLTPEEAAAIQGFPPDFKFAYGSEETLMDDIFRQIGNSIPPNLAYVIAKSLLIQELL